MKPVLDDFTFTYDGREYVAELLPEDLPDAPWENEDGHGPVSGWTTRAKMPGEWVLAEDGPRHLYYDFAEACKIAKRDKWGCLPAPLNTGRAPDGGYVAWSQNFSSYHPTDINKPIRDIFRMYRETMTAKEYAAECARKDFEHLRRFCAGEWNYITLRVRLADSCPCCADAEYLGVVDYDPCEDNEHIRDMAEDLAAELSAQP